jgi:hypothetical protein
LEADVNDKPKRLLFAERRYSAVQDAGYWLLSSGSEDARRVCAVPLDDLLIYAKGAGYDGVQVKP